MTDPTADDRAARPARSDPTAADLEADATTWDRYLEGSATPSHLQSTGWAESKRPNGWRPFRVAAEVDGRVVGAQVLVQRPRGVPWGFGYLGRGPVTPDGRLDRTMIGAITARLRAAGRTHWLGTLRMEPDAEVGDGRLERELIRAGWRRAPHAQPERTRILDLTQDEATLLAGMHRKTRQSIAKSERLGVRVVDGDASRLPAFHAIHTDALRRAGIAARSEASFRTLWDALAPRDQVRLVFAEATDTGEPIATLLLVSCGRRAVDLYGGTTAEGARRRANHLMKWEAIRRCRAAGFTEYDLWGLPREGIEQFKSGFGGREVDYVGAWDLSISRVGAAVLGAGTAAREQVRRWRYRGVHDPDDPHGRRAAAGAPDAASTDAAPEPD